MHFLYFCKTAQNKRKLWKKAEKCGKILAVNRKKRENMKILLINPPNIPFSEQKLLIEPIDIITLGTYLQELKHNVKFLDMDCKKLNSNNLTKYIENEFMPNIVIVSYDYHIPLHTQKALENITEICKELKKYNFKIIMIGKTVTYNPKIIDIINFDIGIIGET